MKVLQILPTLTAGGAEGFVTNLGISLSKLGADVKFFTLAGVREGRGQVLQKRLESSGIEIVGSEERNIRSIKNIFRLAKLIRTWKPDVVQANLFSAEVITAITKTLLTVPKSTIFVYRLANTVFAGSRLREYVFKQLDKKFDLRIACSDAVEKAFFEFMGTNKNRKIVTIPNGGFLAEKTTTPEMRKQARKKLKLGDDAFIFAHIGKMYPGNVKTANQSSLSSGQKAHDVLIKAFSKAFSEEKRFQLVLVGDGPLKTEVEKLVREEGVSGQVHLLGLQPEPWPALQSANVFCFPSRHEGLPNVLPEAASCGLPVVASDIDEIKNIAPGSAWILKPVDDVVSFAEGMKEVVENFEEYSERALKVIPEIQKRYSMSSCAEKYLLNYKQVL